MNDDKFLHDLMAEYKPQLSSDDAFMETFERRLKLIEYVKTCQQAERQKYICRGACARQRPDSRCSANAESDGGAVDWCKIESAHHVVRKRTLYIAVRLCHNNLGRSAVTA